MSAVNERVDLPIEGMTCASCANRIERRLNEVDGVTATVNYATERATVEYDPAAVEPEQLSGRRRGGRVQRAAARQPERRPTRRSGRGPDGAAAPPARHLRGAARCRSC